MFSTLKSRLLCGLSVAGIAVSLTTGSAHAQCTPRPGTGGCATEWSHGKVINLGGLPGSMTSAALGINDAGQAVGFSEGLDTQGVATEWSHGKVINLGGLPGSDFSIANGINNAGQAVGQSRYRFTEMMPSSPSSGATAKSSAWKACRA